MHSIFVFVFAKIRAKTSRFLNLFGLLKEWVRGAECKAR